MPIGLYSYYMHLLELENAGLYETRLILLISARIEREQNTGFLLQKLYSNTMSKED